MKNLREIFSSGAPFEHLVEHASLIHKCVALIRPIANAILEQDMKKLRDLQGEMSKTEYETDLMKDKIREELLNKLFLPVDRDDMLNYMRQLDKMGDDAEDFAVVATFKTLNIPKELHPAFMAIVDKVVEVSDLLLTLANDLAYLQKESFEGADANMVLEKIKQVCQLEWESDKLSRNFARQYYSAEGMDTVTIILLEKLSLALTGIADHAENVGKNLRLMILRR